MVTISLCSSLIGKHIIKTLTNLIAKYFNSSPTDSSKNRSNTTKSINNISKKI